MTDLLLIGAGGHCRACIDVVESGGRFRIRGLVGAPEEVGSTVLGYPVIGDNDDLPRLLKESPAALVAVGQIKSPDTRIRLFEALVLAGARLPAIASPHAVVSRHAELGAGTIVMHGAVVNAGARVGRNVIVNTRALIEHDARVGAHCHVSTGAILNGGAVVEDGSFVGSGTLVREGVSIGARSVIGAGVWVDRNCPPGTVRKRAK